MLLHQAELSDVAGQQGHTLEAGVQAISGKDSARREMLQAMINEADRAGVATEFAEKRVEASCSFIAAASEAGDAEVAAAVGTARND